MATACGKDFTLVVTEEGDLWSFGRGEKGQLGLETREHDQRPARAHGQMPALVGNTFEVFEGVAVVMVAAGKKHAACVTSEGTLWTWGAGEYGKLGHGDEEKRLRPERLGNERFGGSPVMMVACGDDHSLVLTADGLVWSCGCGTFGRLGHGDEERKWTLTLVRFGNLKGSHIVMLAAGGTHSVALGTEGTVWTWGCGLYGQLGHNDGQHRLLPTPLVVESLVGAQIVLVAAGMFYTVALTIAGDLWVWGGGNHGQLGLGDTSGRLAPWLLRAQETFGGSPVLTVACGYSHTQAVTKNGVLWSFGCGTFGENGQNDWNTNRMVPTRIEAQHFGNANIICSSAGYAHSVAVTEEGALYSWGKGQSLFSPGGLGLGDVNSKCVPMPINPSLFNLARIGRYHELPPLHALAFVMGNHARLGRAAPKAAGTEDRSKWSPRKQSTALSIADNGEDCGYITMPGELVQRMVQACVSWPEGRAGELEGLVRLQGGGLMSKVTLSRR